MSSLIQNNSNLYLITGATGNIGGHITDELIQKGHRVRALTRIPNHSSFPEEVEVITGDLTKPETVVDAFEGVTGMHFITMNGDGFSPLETASDLVKLAESAGVVQATVLWSGVPGPFEDAVKASSLEWTILQPQEFMSNALEWKESIRNEDVAREVFGDRKTAYIHPADIASVAATALTEDGHHGKELVLTGPEVLTPKRAVQIIAEVLGREIRFEERSEAEERKRMKEEYRLDQDVIDYVISWTKNPPPEAYIISPAVEEITGRPARTFREWIAENQHQFSEAKIKKTEEMMMNNRQSFREKIIETVTSWPGVEAGQGSRGEFAFKIGRHEIGHLHGDSVAHFWFPKDTGSELREEGRVGPHPVAPKSPKLASRKINNNDDVLDVIALMRMNYDRITRGYKSVKTESNKS